MKSILYQLSKYTPITEPLPEPLSANQGDAKHTQISGSSEDHLWQLASRIVDRGSHANYDGAREAIWAREVNRVARLLIDMPASGFVGVLFSEEILAIYHCFYNRQDRVAGEVRTDFFFKRFLSQVDPHQYQQQFECGVDDITKRLAVVRILLATFATPDDGVLSWPGHSTTSGWGQPLKREDYLPLEFREPAAKYLGLPWPVVGGTVANLQELLTKRATLDQIILGRMGYMLFWSWYHRSGQKMSIPLLSAPRKALDYSHDS